MSTQLKVNEYCRSKGIAFLTCDVRGVFVQAFADFGDSFDVFDKDGEALKEILIANVTQVRKRKRNKQE